MTRTPRSPHDRHVSAALFLAGIATFASIYSTQTLLPLLADDFRITPAQAALSVSATTIALGAALLVVGPLSDAVGRVRIMHASLLASALACLATAFVDDWTHMLALRALLGVLVAGLPAVAAAYLREEIAPGAATAATGLYIGGTAIGGMTGRLLTGLLASWFGWRVGVAGVGVLALACALAVVRLLPPSAHFSPSPLRPRALAANARRMGSDPALLLLYAVGFAAMGSFVALFNALGFRLAAAPYALTPAAASLVYLTFAIGTVSSTTAGRLATSHGPRRVVPAAFAIQLAGVVVTLAAPLAGVVGGVLLVSIGFFAAHGVTSAWVAGRAARLGPGTGQAGGLYLFSYYLGSSSCGTLAGWAWSVGGWPAVAALSGGVAALGIICAWAVRFVPEVPAAASSGMIAG